GRIGARAGLERKDPLLSGSRGGGRRVPAGAEVRGLRRSERGHGDVERGNSVPRGPHLLAGAGLDRRGAPLAPPGTARRRLLARSDAAGVLRGTTLRPERRSAAGIEGFERAEIGE